MSGLTFTLKRRPDCRLDLSKLTPERLNGLDAAAVGRLVVGTNKDRAAAGDVFDIAPGDPSSIRFAGGSERFDRIGENLREGRILIEGDVGQRVGRGMSGGAIEVRGSSGPLAGSGMSGGVLTINGDAGDDLAGLLAGETVGMKGGTIHVLGAVGDRAGERMRRGTILVKGDAGSHVGARMIAGTIVVGGRAGRLPGILMQRGTILLAGGAAEFSPTFLDNGPQDLIILRLLSKAFAQPPFDAGLFDRAPMRRLAGDTAVSSLGEIFVPL